MSFNMFQTGKRSTNWLATLATFCFVFAIAMLLLTAHPATAQTATGTIVGTVTDASGGVVPSTPVTLVNTDTGAKYDSVTDGSGYYQFHNVPPANYKVSISKTGFKALTRGPIKLEVEGSLRINLALEVGSESQTVTVTAASPLIQAETTSIGSVIDERQTTEMPLNGRNAMNLTALVPSVVPQGQASGNTNSANPFGWGNYQIGGGMANQSATFIDGAPINTAYINLTALIPTQDSLAEFKVDTNNLSAEYGHLAGGAVQFSTKSGTNQIHGAMWEYFRNKVLNANDFFSNGDGNPLKVKPRGAFSQNQFGFNVGGPVFIPNLYDGRNKTFFFFNWEGFELRQGQTTTETVPTTDEINGDLSKITANAQGNVPQVYDPNSTCLATPCPYAHETAVGDREPVTNNDLTHMPSGISAIDPVSVAYVKQFYPRAPQSGGVELGGDQNYIGRASIGGSNFEYVAKIDHSFSDKHHIMSRYTYWGNTNLPQDPLGTGICQDRCGETFTTQSWILDDTYTFNPTTILDMRLSYLRFKYGRVALLTSWKPSDIGQPTSLDSQIEYPGPTVISINGYDPSNTFGSGGADSTINNASDIDRLAGNLTKIIGKHTFKVGGEFLRSTFNYSQSNNSAGQGGSNPNFTRQNKDVADPSDGSAPSGSGLAGFLLGYPDNLNYHTVIPNTAVTKYPAVFITDDWRASSKLTFHVGMRWEDDMPWTDRYDRLSYFDVNAVDATLANGAGLNAHASEVTGLKGAVEVVNSATRASRNPWNNYAKQFAPRFGLTYAVTPTTVISGGYGVLWVPMDVGFASSPANDPSTALSTNYVATINNGQTPVATWDDPLPAAGTVGAPDYNPGGIIAPPGRSTDAVHGFSPVLLGQGGSYNFPDNPIPYAQQWNFGVQKQLGSSTAIDIAYAGAKGTHLPMYGLSVSALPDSFVNTDPANICFLKANYGDVLGAPDATGACTNDQSGEYNPFQGIINPTYGLGAATVTNIHMASPLPQYNGISIASGDHANSTYNSLQVKLQKRFTGGASIGAGYTYSKLISGTDTLTGWLESSTADAWGVVDPNNLKLEKSLSSNDTRNRLVITYVYDIPVGRGKAVMANASRLTDSIVGGWGLEGLTTFQSGFPLAIGEQNGTNGVFGMGQRADVAPGCDRWARPSGKTIRDAWFNTSCYSNAAQATFGTAGRNDSQITAPGINNWDTSIFKNVSVDKDGRIAVQFRAEFFNLFNRVQYGYPNTAVGNGAFGTLTSQANLPRLVQFALRIKY